jgi:hypothetical protein
MNGNAVGCCENRPIKLTIRFNQAEQRGIEAATKASGYSGSSAFARVAIRNELPV